MKHTCKRFLAIAMTLAIVLSMLPLSAMAEDAVPHQHNYTSAVTQEATCGAAGVTTFTCAVEGCDRPTYTEAIAATGNHSYAEGVCTVCGGAEHQHNYTSAVTQEATCGAAGVTTFTCAVEGCDRPTYTEAIAATGNHSYAEGVCTVCGAAEPAAHQHNYTSAVTQEATCGAAGVTTFTCAVEGCDRPTYTEAIAATGNHNYAEGVCTVCGAAEPVCEHRYVDGKCELCQKTAPTCVCSALCGDTVNAECEACAENKLFCNPAATAEEDPTCTCVALCTETGVCDLCKESLSNCTPSAEVKLPNAEVIKLGKKTVNVGSYHIYDLIGGSGLSNGTAPFDLQIAMEFLAKDTKEQAQANYYANYTTDFYISMTGIEDGSFVGDGCYLAGYYPSFNAWVKIPLDGFEIENGKTYPVITSAGFDFKYTDICSGVQDFICGIYLSDAVLDTNPNLKVTLNLGLSKTAEEALNIQYVKVDGYEYSAFDIMDPVAKIGNVGYRTLADALAKAQSGDTITILSDIVLTESLTIEKTVTLDLNGKTISQSKACTESYAMINNKGNLTITGNGKLSFTDTSAGDPGFGWGSYTVRNEGTLVVENGTIEHLGAQAFATHCIQAIFQYSGSTTINGGTISTPNYRSVRLWKGSMTINGGTFEGQVWVQCVDDSAKMTINGGSFSPKGNDGSSVFVGNSEYEAELSVTGGNFATKIGANDAASLSESITGGTFTETAKNGTNEVLLNKDFKFQQNANGTYGITAKDYVANIGTTKKYESLQEAVDGAADGETITLMADVTLTAGITADKNLTIDANGHAIKGSNVTMKPASGKTLRLIGLGVNGKLGVDLSANVTATADAAGVITVATAGTEYGSMTLLSKDTQTGIISSRKVFVASDTKLVIKSTSAGFDENAFNGEYMLDMPNKDGEYSGTLNADDLYTRFQNHENTYVRGTNNTLTVVSSGFYDTCVRIYVDKDTVYQKGIYLANGVVVAPGCTELELQSSFLSRLTIDRHTVTFVHEIDGTQYTVTSDYFWVKSSGSVADPTCPKTGDYIMIAVGVLGVSVAALAVLLIIRKKKS